MEKIIEYIKENLKIFVGLFLALAAFSAFYLSRQEKTQDNAEQTLVDWSAMKDKNSVEEKKIEKKDEEYIIVDVKGAVQKPGVYQLTPNARISDAIALAGGFTEQAEKKAVNLAKKLQDEAEVYVPSQGEVDVNKLLEERLPEREMQQEKEKININKADLTELQQLSGVGVKKAQDIIDYRTENGNFQSVDDLLKVSGFGPKTVEKLKENITVD